MSPLQYQKWLRLSRILPVIPPRVLLADDHPGFVAAIRRLLAQDCEVVGSVEDGIQLLEEATRLQPDVIVLDLHMPRLNGLDACQELTRMIPRAIIIALTADPDEDVKRIALAAGAFAFIGKHAAGTDLLPALRMACSERHIAR